MITTNSDVKEILLDPLLTSFIRRVSLGTFWKFVVFVILNDGEEFYNLKKEEKMFWLNIRFVLKRFSKNEEIMTI